MEITHIEKKFKRIGARVKIRDLAGMQRARAGWYSIDIASDKRGEYFALDIEDSSVRFQVIDARRDDRHLLLQADSRRDPRRDSKREDNWRKFLCGHDERHWFVAGIDSKCTSVKQAKDLLMPSEAISSQNRHRVRRKNRHKRRNAGYIRQGEWFFVPVPGFEPSAGLMLFKEPLMRSGGKPHVAEYLYREGGRTVYVCRAYPDGLTPDEYRRVLENDRATRHYAWRVMRMNPRVYVKGYVKHSDHKTIRLSPWHRVLGNTEVFSERVVFLD